MSQLQIQQYLNELQKLKKISGTDTESVVREAFKDLLKALARSHDLQFIAEYALETKTKERRFVDGALLHMLRVPFGYWEAKDSKDDLDAEIQKKFRAGYPRTNIIFEDSTQAILIQHGEEVMRCGVEDVKQLQKLLDLFFGYERPEIEAFRKAVEQFKVDLPAVLTSLRQMIEEAHETQPKFRKAEHAFLEHAKGAINPNLTGADVREMLIQHVLTGEVFTAVFPGTTYHEDNNVARELHKLEATFFTGNTRYQTLKGLDPYYTAIRKAATEIETHHEKQTFLKAIYENFYKVYNPKAADRLGVVYTPNEIVRFMIESADWLCEKHFGKNLIDKQVEILDPAAGTGTFLCELIEHFRGQPAKLKHKYKEELHANEVAILPYYVANLNIEATYAAVTGDYVEFPNLCFVDTLDNTYALQKHHGHMDDLFGSLSDDNVKRIRRQNSRKISVIIGNPPYNANQMNENENNKNREYPEIDRRIKETYIKKSEAQKTKLYDMYVRFFRWASDRVDENGIIAFVTNSSFIDKKTFDGFRKSLGEDFNEVRVVDLKGNARSAGDRRRREGGNIFGNRIRVGIAVWFCVKKKGPRSCRVYYDGVGNYKSADEKIDFLTMRRLAERPFEELRPDKRGNWTAVDDNDFDELLPVADRAAKSSKIRSQRQTIFGTYSLGISTNRDEWLYDLSRDHLENKVRFLIGRYSAHKPGIGSFNPEIKWSETLKRRAESRVPEDFDQTRIRRAAYRPFCSRFLYQSTVLIDRPGAAEEMFPPGGSNRAICFSEPGFRTDYVALAVDGISDLHLGASVDGYQQAPLYSYGKDSRTENITDWALKQFGRHYKQAKGKKDRPITKEAIFHYVYAVLHDPIYREKYALNLKREFPRIPFYSDFWQWSNWGKALMALHIGYEAVPPFGLARTDLPDEKARAAGQSPKALLKADKEAGCIVLDSETTLRGVPAAAWDYRLGNRSALEWILDQYKEKKPKDPTIREHFDTYRFADYKEKVADLLARVTTVSVQTVAIVEAMRVASR